MLLKFLNNPWAIFSVLATLIVNSSPGHAFTWEQALAWQKECTKKNAYLKAPRRDALMRFGISIEIPEDMDYLIKRDGDPRILEIAEIQGMAEAKCNQLGLQLHGMQLPGRGMTVISISETSRSVRGNQDKYLGTVRLLGANISVYEGRDVWATFTNPLTGRPVTVAGYDVNNNFFMSFLQSFRLYR